MYLLVMSMKIEMGGRALITSAEQEGQSTSRSGKEGEALLLLLAKEGELFFILLTLSPNYAVMLHDKFVG